jgi:hypothetical protein
MLHALRSRYEVGRDRFWLYRHLTSIGIDSRVVDSSSIEVNRRQRRAKSDGPDVRKLLGMLGRYHAGESRAGSFTFTPSASLLSTSEDSPHRYRAPGCSRCNIRIAPSRISKACHSKIFSWANTEAMKGGRASNQRSPKGQPSSNVLTSYHHYVTIFVVLLRRDSMAMQIPKELYTVSTFFTLGGSATVCMDHH